MALVLKTILLLLFHLVLGQNTQDIEIILLPLWNAEDRSEVVIHCNIFIYICILYIYIYIYIYKLQNRFNMHVSNLIYSFTLYSAK